MGGSKKEFRGLQNVGNDLPQIVRQYIDNTDYHTVP